MAMRDIRSEDVLGAIALLDDPVEGPKLRRQLHFGRARSYRLLYEGKFYDSKPVVGIAHGLSPAGEYLSGDKFTGGADGAGRVLRHLGFYVDYRWLYEISKLRVDRTHGRPAAYQYVVLLWAVARAQAGLPRMVPFNEVRGELAELLAPFALAETPPDPAMPWLALARSGWGETDIWEGERPPDSVPLNESSVRSFNLAGGLSLAMQSDVTTNYGSLWALHSVRVMVNFMADLTGDKPAYQALAERLGLDQLPQGEELGEASEVEIAIDAIESVTNPRREVGRQRFSAVENKAIEERAVRVTRAYLEDEGYSTEDVGATHSYDVHAIKGEEVVRVEVKGTTTDGAAVVLTRNEVRLHRTEHPNNALAVVRNIVLDHSSDEPSAAGGELVMVMPWKIDEDGLSAIAYEYRTGISTIESG